jgi:hypothetical protein
VPSVGEPFLYLGWCQGDPKFREVDVPRAL